MLYYQELELNSLVLKAMLDENKDYSANTELVRWETQMRKN